MLVQAYVLISELQKQINGNVRVYLSVKDETLVLQCEWLEHGKLIKLEECFSFIDLMKFKDDDRYRLEFFVTKANRVYRGKMEEIKFDKIIEESENAPKT